MGWIETAENPPAPTLLPAFRFFAVMGAWLEGDVIAATVRNAFTQGCERVYLVDNASPDDTVAAACAAGAMLARSFSSESYDETLRLNIMNEVVREVSDAEPLDHVWWLWLDADEFHHGPRGLTLRAYIASLDRRFRIIGARVFNHFPDRKPEYLPGFHPAEFQPLCEEFTVAHCPEGHWKHPLQRIDRHGPPIACDIGFHRAIYPVGPLLMEPSLPVFLHHFQYRDERATRYRLDQLCGQRQGMTPRIALTDARWNGSGISKRFGSLKAVYAQQWDSVADLQRRQGGLGVSPRPWEETISPTDAHFARWYSRPDLLAAIEHSRQVAHQSD